MDHPVSRLHWRAARLGFLREATSLFFEFVVLVFAALSCAMSTLSVTIQYRPVRMGFCVQQNALDDLDRAIRLTHTFWGGRFNPMIPVGSNGDENKLARALVDIFEVDILHPVSSTPDVDAFIKSFPHLPWPKFDRELYIDSPRGKVASFIDIYHPLRSLFEEHIKDKPEPRASATLYEWDVADPLKYVLLATFGSIRAVMRLARTIAISSSTIFEVRELRLAGRTNCQPTHTES